MIERISLDKFTAFESLDVTFSPGINILIGQNGTGKTHLLKLLYAALSAHQKDEDISDELIQVFLPKEKRLGRMVKRGVGRRKAKAAIWRDGKKFSFEFSTLAKQNTGNGTKRWPADGDFGAVYIPVKEMLANAPGFLSMYKNREVSFESVYADIIEKALLPKLSGPIPEERRVLLEHIQKIMEGWVKTEGEHFFLKDGKGELEFTLLAEGIRKLGLIWVLIQNGVLQGGKTLLWDEPEANLNPSMVTATVDILLSLQRQGIQIFLATHNYALLKLFDLKRGPGDGVKFISLFFTDEEGGGVEAKSGDNYLDIVPNKISDTYSEIFDLEVKRTLGWKS